ncbi:MAG TPA: RHS repeat-associated core domain-containing protein [Candidatus Angelobacter sp.]|jgi:RHS repeat-associated protein|nr:RHS repeat-associated core domain-containing protein [Candidatus Angelobacter sp.]
MSYTYDGNGERVLKSNTSTGAAVKRYWSIGGNTLAEGDGSGNLTAEYIYFGGKRVARIDLPANTVHYYLSDHLASTSIVASAAGTVEEESDYYPFGTEVIVTGPGVNELKFTGKERDSETNLDYFGARYYGNALGRFMTPDWSAKPVTVPYADLHDPQTLNQYAYVRNSPISKADPDGHEVVLNGDQKDRQEEQNRILQNASKKGEAALFKTETGKDGKNRLVLDKKAAAGFKGEHSKGFKMLTEAIDSKKTADVVMTNTDSRTVSEGNGNFRVELDRNESGIDKVSPLRSPEGKPIPNPFNIIAGHELLGHARLGMEGKPNGEGEARGVENQLRKEQGLPLRDPNSN